MDYCKDCHTRLPRGSKNRCWECHVKNLKARAKDDLTICRTCGKSAKDYGLGQCKSCYRWEYSQRPEVKQANADYERNRRAKGLHRDSEEKRKNDPYRLEWKRRYYKKNYQKNRESIRAYQRNYQASRSDWRQQENARRAVNRKIQKHEMAPPKTLNCLDCGKRKAQGYHHHNGYSEAHRFDVIPLCAQCHGRRHWYGPPH